jgi:hypothetical protein
LQRRIRRAVYPSICQTSYAKARKAADLSDFAEGPFHGCGIRKSDASVACWTEVGWRGEPGPSVRPPTGAFAQVVSGLAFSCVRDDQGTATCFGPNAAPPPDGELYLQLSAGPQTLCAIRQDTTLACWGPGQLTPPPGQFKKLSCGDEHCCAIRLDDTVACFGNNADDRATPPTGTFTTVVAASEHSCGTRAEGTVCWGKNRAGQCDVPSSGTGHAWKPASGK